MLGNPSAPDTRSSSPPVVPEPATPPANLERGDALTSLPSNWWQEWNAGITLQQRASRVFNLPSAIFLLARWCALTMLLGVALSWWLFSPLTLLPGVLIILYAAVIGAGLGATWGAVRVVDLAMDNIWQLVVMVIEGLESAMAEVDSLRRGKLSASALQTLSHTLYQGLFYPVVRRASQQAAGIFARPLTWALDKTIARLISRTLRPTEPETDSPNRTSAATSPEPGGAALETLGAAHARLLRLRSKTRTIALTPLVALATLNSLLMTAPIVGLYLLLN
ncbi:hypothetical protein FRC98_10440 [Lujinxingia vulgaris]|uniref:Uncharacterized protein n=1 Tax=Lujinxingia vulgaris TaxID=2600176 RepID=A0A5C6X775_9DELT|nr:hypothetical protein [Lujinxingia vulgaris]TXD37144.1 hypothetical protein FRC98_10440 [Lujinxingia vulgaris]